MAYNITKEFTAAQNKNSVTDHLTSFEASILFTAALIHDWGELEIENMGHGDVTFEEHGKSHDKTERLIFERVTERIIDSSDQSFIRQVYKQVTQDKNRRLGRMFSAIERIGYLKTGLRAYKGFKGMRIDNWAGLAGNVLSNQIISLLEYAPDYPYIKDVLVQNSDLITDAFSDIYQIETPSDNRGVPSYDSEKFLKNHQAWLQSLSSP